MKSLPLFMVLCACAAQRPAQAEATGPVWPKVSLQAMGFPVHATQQVTMTRGEETHDFTAVLERDDAHLVVAGMGSMGPRLFKVTKSADGTVKGEANPLVPKTFQPEFLLADLELAFASSRSLFDAFESTGWSLLESGRTRTLQANGVTVSTVTRTTDDPWAGTVDLENVRFGYHLRVETTERE